MSSPEKNSNDSCLRPKAALDPVETEGGQMVERREKKIVLHWIDGGTLLERWGIDASYLKYLIFEKNLRGFEIRFGTWIQPYNFSPTGYGSSTYVDTDLLRLASYPIEDQKEALKLIVRFDPKDIEAFEKDHKELLQTSKSITPENISPDVLKPTSPTDEIFEKPRKIDIEKHTVNKYAKFDEEQARKLYGIKIHENKIDEKQREETGHLLNDFIQRGTRSSGVFYKSKIKLYFKHIEEKANIFLDTQLSEIERGKPISKELKNHIIGNIRAFIGNTSQSNRAELHGLLEHDGLSKSILADTFEKHFEGSLQATLSFFINKIDYEITKRNKEFRSRHEESIIESQRNAIRDDVNNHPKEATDTVSQCFEKNDLSSIIEKYNLTEKQVLVLQYFIDQKKEGKIVLREKTLFTKLQQESEITSDRMRDTFKWRPEALKALFKKEKPGFYSLKIPI